MSKYVDRVKEGERPRPESKRPEPDPVQKSNTNNTTNSDIKENEKMILLDFINGDISVATANDKGTNGIDNLLILEQGLGTKVIGQKVPSRPKGHEIKFNDNGNHKDGIWLRFENSKSVNVVITRLQRIKRQIEKGERKT